MISMGRSCENVERRCVENVREEGEGRFRPRWRDDHLRTIRTNDAGSSSRLLEKELRLDERVRVTAVVAAAHGVLAETGVGLRILRAEGALHPAKVTPRPA